MAHAVDENAKSVCIAFATGCLRSEMSTAKVFAYFEANGWDIKERFHDADLVVVFTCGVDPRSEEHSMALLSTVDKKRRAGSKFIVCGCLAGINRSRIEKALDVVTISPVEINELDAVIDAKVKLRDVQGIHDVGPYIDKARHCFSFRERYLRSSLVSLGRGDPGLIKRKLREKISKGSLTLEFSESVFSVVVSHGCLEECSYCAIRFAEGTLRSRPLERVLEEFDAGLSEGHERVRIIGTDVGAYGQDLDINVTTLLRKLFEREERFHLELTDLHPKWFIAYSKELIKLLAENTHRTHLVIVPIQSGSDRVLKLMKRGHTALEAQERLSELRKACPETKLATHVLVGFPSETDSDFEATIEFLKKASFDRIDIYEYGDRPNTPASQMKDKISRATMRSRIRRLREEFPQTWYQP